MPNCNKTTKKSAANRENPKLLGLGTFRKSLERDFFAECETFCQWDKDGASINLTVTLQCTLNLTECLFHLNTVNWGGFLLENDETPKFEKSINDLAQKNKTPFEIVEFCINFPDTSVIVSKIYSQSISDCLGVILPAISANFVHFTKGLTEMPFEIFVPVFLEEKPQEGTQHMRKKNGKGSPTDYFGYWGLYFESNAEKDAVIYHVKSKKITEGDFLLIDY